MKTKPESHPLPTIGEIVVYSDPQLEQPKPAVVVAVSHGEGARLFVFDGYAQCVDNVAEGNGPGQFVRQK